MFLLRGEILSVNWLGWNARENGDSRHLLSSSWQSKLIGRISHSNTNLNQTCSTVILSFRFFNGLKPLGISQGLLSKHFTRQCVITKWGVDTSLTRRKRLVRGTIGGTNSEKLFTDRRGCTIPTSRWLDKLLGDIAGAVSWALHSNSSLEWTECDLSQLNNPLSCRSSEGPRKGTATVPLPKHEVTFRLYKPASVRNKGVMAIRGVNLLDNLWAEVEDKRKKGALCEVSSGYLWRKVSSLPRKLSPGIYSTQSISRSY